MAVVSDASLSLLIFLSSFPSFFFLLFFFLGDKLIVIFIQQSFSFSCFVSCFHHFIMFAFLFLCPFLFCYSIFGIHSVNISFFSFFFSASVIVFFIPSLYSLSMFRFNHPSCQPPFSFSYDLYRLSFLFDFLVFTRNHSI